MLKRCDRRFGYFNPIVDPIYAPLPGQIRQTKVVREAQVVFSPELGLNSCYFTVESDGLHSID